MSSIMKSYREYVKEMKEEQEINISEYAKREYIYKQRKEIYEQREELMLKGQNRRGTYSLERVCLANDRKR